MSSRIYCGPCSYESSYKNAFKWCIDCSEGFCSNCEKVHRATKMSRNHHLISIESYRLLDPMTITQTCVDHERRLDLFCKTHDKVLCIECVSEHKACPEIVPLDLFVKDAHNSTALCDLEEIISKIFENIKDCNTDRLLASEEITKQVQDIQKTVQDTCKKLNNIIKVCEEKVMQELSEIHERCKSACKSVSDDLDASKKRFERLKDGILKIKQLNSDMLVFLGYRKIKSEVFEESNALQKISQASKDYNLNFQFHQNISLFLKLETIGRIVWNEIPAKLQFKEPLIEKAQSKVQTTKSMLQKKRPLIYAENRGQQVTTAGFGDVYCPRGKVQRVEDRERNLQEGGYERKKPDVENWGAHLEKTSLVVKHQKVVDWAEISKVYSLKRANQKVKVENWAANWKGDGLEGNEQISVDWTRDGWARTQRGRGQCNGRGVHDAPVSPVNFNRSTATIPISSRRIYYT